MNNGECRSLVRGGRLEYRILSFLYCAVICFLLLIISLVCRPGQALSQPIPHESENGAAALTYRVDRSKGFVFSANLNLPEHINNRSWYCVWLMVAEPKGTNQHPSMLQVGLMRWDQSKFQMQPFITTEQAGKELEFKPVAETLSGYHRFAVVGDSSTIQLKMDGKALMSAPRSEFLKRDSRLYLKIAAEVFAVGDAASGLIKDVTLINGGEKEDPPITYAAFEDRGLTFSCKGKGQWEATGRFDPTAPRSVQYEAPPCR
jgi:hypothetical protein